MVLAASRMLVVVVMAGRWPHDVCDGGRVRSRMKRRFLRGDAGHNLFHFQPPNLGMAITLCSVGVGTVTGPLAESWSLVCWPAGGVADPRGCGGRRWHAGSGAPGEWWRRLHRRRMRPA